MSLVKTTSMKLKASRGYETVVLEVEAYLVTGLECCVLVVFSFLVIKTCMGERDC